MIKIATRLLPLAYGKYFNIASLVAPKKTADTAFHLFCTVRKGRVLPQQKGYLDNAKFEMLQIADHAIQTYRWPGSKETVLLVHGWESNSFRWRNLIEKLQANDYNIMAFDAPAHGYSSGKILYVPLYAQVLQHVLEKYRPKFLIGHSVAGMTMLYNEHQNPNTEIKKMITVGSPSEFHEIMGHYQHLLKFNDRVWGVLDEYIHTRFGFRIKEFSTSRYAKSITKKGLLFHDKHDTVAPYHASVQVHANWKNSRLVSTEGFGHSMHQDEVNDQIIDFLKS